MRTSASGAPQIAASGPGERGTRSRPSVAARWASCRLRRPSRTPTRPTSSRITRRPPSSTSEAVQDNPEPRHRLLLPGQQLRQPLEAQQEGRRDQRRPADESGQNYQKAAEKLSTSDKPEDKKLGKLSLQYLVQAYGAGQAERPRQGRTGRAADDSARPARPRQLLRARQDLRRRGRLRRSREGPAQGEGPPSRATRRSTCSSPATTTARATSTRRFRRSRSAPQREPNNPEAYYTIATFYWDEAYRDPRLKETDKTDYVEKGIEAIDQALKIKPDYTEALVYKDLLLRLEANLEKDPAKQQALIKEADQLRDKAEEIRKEKAAGVSN